MPASPTDPAAPRRPSVNPARVMLDSPLAAATRARVYRQRNRQHPRERWLRILAMVGALLVHLVFLFGFVLGPAYEPLPHHEPKSSFLQIRLIPPPEPPPPPPVRGTPPKVRGPRHQGHAAALAVASRPAAASAATPKPSPAALPSTPPAAPSAPQPLAAATPALTLPQPAPAPALQPVPLAGEPPVVTLPTPPLPTPVPPKFQPQPVRAPQLEGNRPLPPPPSLALPAVPPQAAPPVAAPSIALNLATPRSDAPPAIKPAPLVMPAAPPMPELQPITLPAQRAPAIELQAATLSLPPPLPRERPQLQAPAIAVAAVQPEAIPPTPAADAHAPPSPPAVKIETAPVAIAVRPVAAPASLSVPAAALTPLPAAQPGPPSPVPATQPATLPSSAAASGAANPAPASAPDASTPDASTAPDATPQGSDSAVLGNPASEIAAPANPAQGADGRNLTQKAGSGSHPGNAEGKLATGLPGGNQPGAAQGATGSYVELKPTGDTRIMNHGSPNIGYKPTIFDKDWTPEGESSVDTALRRAEEKTAVSHTFHLPRGVRVKCSLHPLLPIALFGCSNPDPPPAPVAAKVYDRLHLPPANPVAMPAPATTGGASAAAPLRLDNSVMCATAHVAGAPPPPGCASIALPVKLTPRPASSSTSWVPASDQFH